MIVLCGLSIALAAPSLSERLAERATQPDVTLTPPISDPSPAAGSFLIPYTPEGEPDPKRVGTYEVAASSCTAELAFKVVPSSESREELWMMDSGAGATVGLPQFGIKIGGGTKSMAGIRYTIQDKLIVEPDSIKKLESCCMRNPEKCTDRYIAEYWRGVGALHRSTGTDAALKTSLKALDKVGKIDFGVDKGWTMSSKWEEPQYFAYRVQRFQLPSCQSYMNDLPEVEGKLLFAGVSARSANEQTARMDARNDARQQLVRYLGEEFKITGDQVTSSAEALISRVKDGLTCLDEPTPSPEGPQYLARVVMYVDAAGVEAAAKEMTK
jgi:hypothetical protein